MSKFDKDSAYGQLVLGAIADYDRSVGRSPEEADRLGGSLWAPYDLEQDMATFVQTFNGNISISVDANEVSIPRHGLLTLLSRNTQVFVYGHPALKKFCTTAFTDGINMFFADTFFDELLYSNQEHPNTKGVEFVIGHELTHKFRNHNRRLKNFSHALANEATDLSINTTMQLAFPEMRPCPLLLTTGVGFKEGEKERFSMMSELAIAEALYAERHSFLKDREVEPEQGGPGGPSGEKGGPGGQGGGGGGGGQGDAGGSGGGTPNYEDMLNERAKRDPLAPISTDEALKNLNDLMGPSEERHYISPEELIEALNEAGLENVLEKLGYPTEITEEAIEEIERLEGKVNSKDLDALSKAAADRQKYGDRYPGSHMVDFEVDRVDKLGAGILGWRLKMRKSLILTGNKTGNTYDFPAELYYVDEVTESLGLELYLPAVVPVKNDEVVVFIIDSSGSMDQQALRSAVQEAITLQKESIGMGDSAAEVIVIACDTAIRGEPILINDSNVEEFLKKGVVISGRGGTSLQESLQMVADLPILKTKKVKSFVYASDLYDDPVKKLPKKFIDDGCKVVFLADPGTSLEAVERFARGSLSEIDVYRIEAGITVDLTENQSSIKDTYLNKKKSKMKPN